MIATLTGQFGDHQFGQFLVEDTGGLISNIGRGLLPLSIVLLVTGLAEADPLRMLAGAFWTVTFALMIYTHSDSNRMRAARAVVHGMLVIFTVVPVAAVWFRLRTGTTLDIPMNNMAVSQILPLSAAAVTGVNGRFFVFTELCKSIVLVRILWEEGSHCTPSSASPSEKAMFLAPSWILVAKMLSGSLFNYCLQIHIKGVAFQALQAAQLKDEMREKQAEGKHKLPVGCEAQESEETMVVTADLKKMNARLAKLKHHLDGWTLLFTDNSLNETYDKWIRQRIMSTPFVVYFVINLIMASLIPAFIYTLMDESVNNSSMVDNSLLKNNSLGSSSVGSTSATFPLEITIIVAFIGILQMYPFLVDKIPKWVSNWGVGVIITAGSSFTAIRVVNYSLNRAAWPLIMVQYSACLMFYMNGPLCFGCDFKPTSLMIILGTSIFAVTFIKAELSGLPLIFLACTASLQICYIYHEIRWQKLYILCITCTEGCDVSTVEEAEQSDPLLSAPGMSVLGSTEGDDVVLAFTTINE